MHFMLKTINLNSYQFFQYKSGQAKHFPPLFLCLSRIVAVDWISLPLHVHVQSREIKN